MALNHLKFRHPFTCMLSGPTSSGKTILIRSILRAFKLLIEFKEDVKKFCGHMANGNPYMRNQ